MSALMWPRVGPNRFAGFSTPLPREPGFGVFSGPLPTSGPMSRPMAGPGYGLFAGARKKKLSKKKKKVAKKKKAPSKTKASPKVRAKALAAPRRAIRDQSDLIEAIRMKNLGDTAAYMRLFQKHAKPAQWGVMGSKDTDDDEDDDDEDYTDEQ